MTSRFAFTDCTVALDEAANYSQLVSQRTPLRQEHTCLNTGRFDCAVGACQDTSCLMASNEVKILSLCGSVIVRFIGG